MSNNSVISSGESSSISTKVSFSGFKMPSSSSAGASSLKRKQVEEDNREYVTGVSGNQIQSAKPISKNGPLVIPLPEVRKAFSSKYIGYVRTKKGEKLTADEQMKILGDDSLKQKSNSSQMDILDTKLDSPSSSGILTPISHLTLASPNSSSGQLSSGALLSTEINSSSIDVKEQREKTLDELAADEVMEEAKVINEGKTFELNSDLELPMLVKYRDPTIDSIQDENEKFKMDVLSRPESASIEEYSRVPIEAFGKGLLRGMGWTEGGAIGLTNPKYVEPVEYLSRPGYRTGLGADPLNMPGSGSNKKRRLKPGEKAEDFEKKVLPPNADGTIRHTKRIDEKLVPISKTGIQVGSLVAIISGRHDGLYARVLTISGDDVVVQLEASYEEVKVSKSDVTLLDESKLSGHPTFKSSTNQSSNSKDKSNIDKDDLRNQGSSSRDSKNSKDKSSKSSSSSSSYASSSSSSSSKRPEPSWIYPHIVVRIISKSFSSGKYYLKKGTILDVTGRHQCTLQLLENNQLLEVQQKHLETVIPRVGEKVMIVEGELSGQIGTLMAKSTDKSEVAVVQLASDLSIGNYSLDHITQYSEPRR